MSMDRSDFDPLLLKYICEKAGWTQGQLAERLGTTQQALNNRARRGSLQLNRLSDIMQEEGIAVPKFAEGYSEFSTHEDEAELRSLKAENTELRKRLEAAETTQRELMEMLKMALQK